MDELNKLNGLCLEDAKAKSLAAGDSQPPKTGPGRRTKFPFVMNDEDRLALHNWKKIPGNNEATRWISCQKSAAHGRMRRMVACESSYPGREGALVPPGEHNAAWSPFLLTVALGGLWVPARGENLGNLLS